jgi:hypothetical protein
MIFIESRSEVVDEFGVIVNTEWSLKVIARLEFVKKKKLLGVEHEVVSDSPSDSD